MGAFFKQAQKLQERLAQVQESLAEKTVKGTASGGDGVGGDERPAGMRNR
ncbi:MAG TPA: hypothetical protein EYP17_02265 [Candidatus Latescibacteria bacterium]|nr:hypothetical protein [Candidatus Latescibacterota bacterium]